MKITVEVTLTECETLALFKTLEGNTMGQDDIDALTQAVSDTETIDGSAATLLDGLTTLLENAQASGDSTQVQALTARLVAAKGSLAAALTRNTPADPGSTGTVPAGSDPATGLPLQTDTTKRVSPAAMGSPAQLAPGATPPPKTSA